MAGIQFYVENWPALSKGSGGSYSQRTWNTIGIRGGKKNYDNGDYYYYDDDDYDDYDDDNDHYNFFSFIPKDLKQGWHQGEPINYDGEDEIDDNDNNDDDNDDDDDDDNNDGNGVFSS